MLLGAPWLIWVGLWIAVGFAVGVGLILGVVLLFGVIFTTKKQEKDKEKDDLVKMWDERARKHEGARSITEINE